MTEYISVSFTHNTKGVLGQTIVTEVSGHTVDEYLAPWLLKTIKKVVRYSQKPETGNTFFEVSTKEPGCEFHRCFCFGIDYESRNNETINFYECDRWGTFQYDGVKVVSANALYKLIKTFCKELN